MIRLLLAAPLLLSACVAAGGLPAAAPPPPGPGTVVQPARAWTGARYEYYCFALEGRSASAVVEEIQQKVAAGAREGWRLVELEGIVGCMERPLQP